MTFLRKADYDKHIEAKIDGILEKREGDIFLTQFSEAEARKILGEVISYPYLSIMSEGIVDLSIAKRRIKVLRLALVEKSLTILINEATPCETDHLIKEVYKILKKAAQTTRDTAKNISRKTTPSIIITEDRISLLADTMQAQMRSLIPEICDSFSKEISRLEAEQKRLDAIEARKRRSPVKERDAKRPPPSHHTDPVAPSPASSPSQPKTADTARTIVSKLD